MMTYPRNMLGYGETPPVADWPNGAKIAVQIVLNFEEGGENCVLHGDEASESFLSEIPNAKPLVGKRHMNMESVYEYGTRAGFWRLHRLFTTRKIPLTVFGVSMALARHPAAVAAMKAADWEIASHGWRWIDYATMDEKSEYEHLKKALETHIAAVGEAPLGWYIGRTSENTRRLLWEMGEWLYDADSYADDLPYWTVRKDGKPHLIVPYTLDANDMRFANPAGFTNGEQFFQYLKDSFDTLYAEGESRPRMMSVGLHCRLAGRPGRHAAVARFLDYASSHDKVWFCRRADIANHWHKHHKPK